MGRLTKIQYGILLAISASSRSEDNWTKCGAYLTDLLGNPLSLGYNGLKPGQTMPKWMTEEKNRAKKSDFFIHAEENLFSRDFIRQPSILYLTINPCPSCAKIIVANQVKKVYYPKLYERSPEKFKEVLEFHHIEHELLEVEESIKEFWYERYNRKHD